MFGLRWYNAKKTPVWHVWPEIAPSPHSHTLSKRPLSGMFGLRWFIPHTAHLQKKTPVWNVWPEMAPSPHRHPAPHSQVPTHSPSQHLSSSPTILSTISECLFLPRRSLRCFRRTSSIHHHIIFYTHHHLHVASLRYTPKRFG